jgi:hypothetical protein
MAQQIVSQKDFGDKNISREATPSLWVIWWNAIVLLRPAFSQLRTFMWFAAAVAGLMTGTDMLGAASIMRALKLHSRCYDALIRNFHNDGVHIDALAALWGIIVAPQLFSDKQVRVGGRRVLVGDGIKIPKRGKKMPAVKLVHQESDNKAEYAMAHSLQAVSMLVYAGSGVIAVPLAMRIHEGLIWCNAHKQTLLTKMLTLLGNVTAGDDPYIFVADAYYAARVIINGLLAHGNHLVTRVKRNAVGYVPHVHHGARKRGRPRVYGERIEITTLLNNRKALCQVASPLFGEQNITLHYAVRDLLWKPVGRLVRFVAVAHPSKGSWLLLCTDMSLEPIEIIRLYGLRFRIEHSFKQAVHTIGTFCYRFWMKEMTPLHHGDGNQYLHRKSLEYREAVKRKIHAYHVFIQAGVIAQGLLQYLSATFPKLIWASFGSWLRTIRPGVAPSEFVAAQALRQSLPHFLLGSAEIHPFAKFITQRQKLDNPEMFRMVA